LTVDTPVDVVCRNAWQERERVGKEEDTATLTKLIRNRRPHGIAICTEDRWATILSNNVPEP
jgi:hypothetical protein